MLRAVHTVAIWSALLLCGGIGLVMVKELVKIVFEGLTTW